MRVETVKCDQCGAMKGEGNHWLKLKVAPALGDLPLAVHASTGENDRTYLEESWETRDLCGQACFHKHLDALLFPEKKGTVIENCIFFNNTAAVD